MKIQLIDQPEIFTKPRLAVLVFVLGYFAGIITHGALRSDHFRDEGRTQVYQEAVKQRAAAYASDPDGRPTLRWCKCTALGVQGGC